MTAKYPNLQISMTEIKGSIEIMDGKVIRSGPKYTWSSHPKREEEEEEDLDES